MFGMSERREKKEQKEIQEIMDNYGFNELSEQDLESVRNINSDLAGLGLMKTGIGLSFGKSEDIAKIGYLSALVEQNWIMIRLLNEINNKLDD